MNSILTPLCFVGCVGLNMGHSCCRSFCGCLHALHALSLLEGPAMLASLHIHATAVQQVGCVGVLFVKGLFQHLCLTHMKIHVATCDEHVVHCVFVAVIF